MKIFNQVKQLKTHLIFAVLIGVQTCYSQILVGPTVGGQINWISFNDKGYHDTYADRSSFGYQAGASVSFKMMKNVFIQSSFLYSQKGKTIIGKKDTDLKNTAKYNFIDVPITFTKEFKLKFGKGKFYKVYLGAGPTLSYWLGGKGTLHSSDLNENLINPPDYSLSYKLTFRKDPSEVNLGEMNIKNPNRLLLGFNVSCGLIFEPVGLNKFMFTTRYEVGHTFFSQDSQGDYGLSGILFYKDDLQSRYRGFSLSLSYFIDLKTDDRNKGKSTSKIRSK
jgi:hypothetical protein